MNPDGRRFICFFLMLHTNRFYGEWLFYDNLSIIGHVDALTLGGIDAAALQVVVLAGAIAVDKSQHGLHAGLVVIGRYIVIIVKEAGGEISHRILIFTLFLILVLDGIGIARQDAKGFNERAEGLGGDTLVLNATVGDTAEGAVALHEIYATVGTLVVGQLLEGSLPVHHIDDIIVGIMHSYLAGPSSALYTL